MGMKARWWGLLLGVLLLCLGGLAFDAWRTPDAPVPTASADNPFLVHFKLKNPSLFFTMSSLQLVCLINEAEFDRDIHLADVTSAVSRPVDIEPSSARGYACHFDRDVAGLGPLRNISVSLKGGFTVLGVSRRFETAQFHWDSGERAWKAWIAAQ
jgi:hypothetical protein